MLLQNLPLYGLNKEETTPLTCSASLRWNWFNKLKGFASVQGSVTNVTCGRCHEVAVPHCRASLPSAQAERMGQCTSGRDTGPIPQCCIPQTAWAQRCVSAKHCSRCLTLTTCLQSAGWEVYEPSVMASVVNPDLWLFQNKRNWKGRDAPLCSDQNQQLAVHDEQLLEDKEKAKGCISAAACYMWSSCWLLCTTSAGCIAAAQHPMSPRAGPGWWAVPLRWAHGRKVGKRAIFTDLPCCFKFLFFSLFIQGSTQMPKPLFTPVLECCLL